MKNRLKAAVSVLLALSVLAGCGGGASQGSAPAAASAAPAETSAAAASAPLAETTAAAAAAAPATASNSAVQDVPAASAAAPLRVGSLKGPTTMGLVNLMADSEEGKCAGSYSFMMSAQPDEILAGMAGGKLDIALVPANAASVLYNKTGGAVSVIGINTLGVLYLVTADDSVQSVKDLSGRSVMTTGQGATPEYVLNYLLERNGVTDCALEFRSEAAEIAAILKEKPELTAVLPQPFVTAALAKNDRLKTAFSLTDEWDRVSDGSKLVTGVTIVRNEVLESRREEVELFLEEQAESVDKAFSDPDGTAEKIVTCGIIEKAPVAKKALPECSLVCITGNDMKEALSGYLEVLYDQDPKAVGGALPEDGFYYIGE